jgi:hypothetical protein
MATNAITKPGNVPPFDAALAQLKREAESIVIRDAESCRQAKQVQLSDRNYMKDVHFKLDPFVESAKRALDDAKAQRSQYIDPADAIDTTLGNRVKAYEREEAERAEAERRREQDRLNQEAEARAEEQRKADLAAAEELRKQTEARIKEQQKAGELSKAEAKKALAAEQRDFDERVEQAHSDAKAVVENVPQIKVEAAIPKVQGVPTHKVNWKFKVVDAKKLPRKYMKQDDVEIGVMVRKVKDKAKAEAECPGIEVWPD